jgi:hypothetical protein
MPTRFKPNHAGLSKLHEGRMPDADRRQALGFESAKFYCAVHRGLFPVAGFKGESGIRLACGCLRSIALPHKEYGRNPRPKEKEDPLDLPPDD